MNEHDFTRLLNDIPNGKILCKLNYNYFTNYSNKCGLNLYEDLQILISSYILDDQLSVLLDEKLNQLIIKMRLKYRTSLKIWQFFIEILKDGNENLLKWVEFETGIFEIINKKDLSRLWGILKNNYSMNYDKLAKAIRINYRKKIFSPHSTKNFYKFNLKFLQKYQYYVN